MDDHEVIRAFVHDGARRVYGPTVHVEGDGLILAGWWQTAFRLSADAFILRNEEPPEATTTPADLAGELRLRGLEPVAVDLPLIDAVTYTTLILGHVSWELWAADLAAGEQALLARAGAESFLGDPVMSQPSTDLGTELGGARRLAGLPASLVLGVGVAPHRAQELEAAFPDCQCDCRPLGQIDAQACCTLLPTLVLVDATSAAGRGFIADLRATPWGSTVPLVALTDGDDHPAGADAAVAATEPTSAWAERLGRLLP